MKKHIYKGIAAGWLILSGLGISCNVLDQDPQFQIATEEAFANAVNAEAALNGLYNEAQLVYNWRVQTLGELASDLVQSVDTWDNFNVIDEFRQTPDNTEIDDLYTQIYRTIDLANNIIAFAPNVPDLSQERINDMLGQAYAFRGMMYFHLATYFGGIPGKYGELGVIIETEPSIGVSEDAFKERASLEETWNQARMDLEQGESLLPESRASNFLSRSRLTKAAAAAMLARHSLYLDNWTEAESKATQVINQGSFELVQPFSDIFRTDFSAESIFEMHYNVVDFSGFRQWYFPASLNGRGGLSFHQPFAQQLLDRQGEDDRSDLIALNPAFGGVYYSTKFDELQNASNVPVLRIAEMYLIRSEARARQGNVSGAISDLNAVRNRAGLADVSSSGGEELIDLILEERKFEFAIEGHRFFDMTRTDRAIEVFTDLPRTTGSTTYSIGDRGRYVFPIPNSEIFTNSNMVQNPAYR
ncbi:RagB/SusD family nutrient uptake outer membrane protein [Arthrospiribacter ruber]|uniref:RagB/SusD family nutrient uptake outer membrane protein n=1 Tax=Arthrospiribacter ruber TaxID=2487934 RepID=A0A951IYC8_9BACT|nr:RagB/SusD family nutrient uptake outer membrane protein [Arthrospiribacter ruber]MBW3468622.1 RagB/SusD family nutrient uptake outer membrane protein [Arthrospiribacter ruber]